MMSRFFRSSDSTSSSDNSESDEEQLQSNDGGADAGTQAESSAIQRTGLGPQSQDWTNHHRDFLLHALLEERCMNEVLASYNQNHASGRRPSRDIPQVQDEANAKYQQLCAHLASYNLISTGLEGDQHAITRQRYREGLDVLGGQRSATAVPQPIQQLLTDSTALSGGQLPDSGAQLGPERGGLARPLPTPLRRLISTSAHTDESILGLRRTLTNSLNPRRSLSPSTAILRSRYHDDFEEINILGRGGYGVVYHVRHRLDNQVYAVKKVPLSTARLHRIQQRGEVEVQDVLRELRTLAKLDHPNVVRYFNGWIEWVDSIASSNVVHSDLDSRFLEEDRHTSAGADAADLQANKVDLLVTESSLEGLSSGIVFESSLPESIRSNTRTESSIATATRTIASVSDEEVESVDRQIEPSISMQSAATGVQFTEPTLAIHVQMSLSAMTLSDYIAPPTPAISAAPPLSHCFHLQPSISIMLAILDGLEYLHNEGIVHRDIKPANIFLAPCNTAGPPSGSVDLMKCSDCLAEERHNPVRLEVRIGDFGLATVANPDAASPQPSEPVGTAIYRPPSALAQHTSLDIYALGIVACELLWKFDTRMERLQTLQQLKQGEFPAGLSKNEAVKSCISSMLALDGNATSIVDLRQKLAACCNV